MSIFNKNKLNQNDIEFGLIDDNSPFALKEAYSALYTNIIYIGVGDKCKKIVITSAVPSEGKSTVSANLAISIAKNSEDKKVLLIDADLRAPKISKLFGIDEGTTGLSEYLAGVDAEPNFIHLEDRNLTVLASGAKSLNPTQLLSSSSMEKLLTDCDADFDYIVIDTPPVNLFTDALMFNNYVNGYIISTLSERSDTKSITECVGKLNQVGAEVIGFVYSGSRLKSFSGKYKYSKQYSNYTQR